MRLLVFAAVVSSALLIAPARAKAQSDLDQLDKKFTHYLEKVMPGWKHERGEAFGKSENVLIQFWYSADTSVKISVVPHRSANEAREAVERVAGSDMKREILRDIGDDAYAWGFKQSNVVLSKGKFVIYISTRADAGSTPEVRSLSQEERLDRERNEMRRWSREFAKHAAKAVDEL
jgi:hypothetical protein